MRRIKMMLLATIAMFAFVAAGSGSAWAGSGEVTTNWGRCDVVFNSASVVSPDPIHLVWDHSRELNGLAPDPGIGKSCDWPDVRGSMHLHWMNTGQSEVVGQIQIPSLFGWCAYSGTLAGTYAGGVFTLSPSPQTILLFSGSPCPASAIVSTPTWLTP
ncbi:MAG: hypothetical protein J0H98_05515 [Solirubrobacterales bacterium]|nr:hypothetical protein [Solirubrobacterales bacterium]